MYISIGPSTTIDIMYGLPSDVYQLGRLRRLILCLDYPPIFNIFRQPSEPFSQELPHAFTPIVLGAPVHMECMMPILFQFNNICKYIIMHIFT